jgi:tRNA modification GTPase
MGSECAPHTTPLLSKEGGRGEDVSGTKTIPISAKTGLGLDELRDWLVGSVDVSALEAGAAVVSGARHFEALTRAREAIERVLDGLGRTSSQDASSRRAETTVATENPALSVDLSTGVSADLLAEDVRETLHYLGTITGHITPDDILTTIFSKFCIGK